MNAKPGSSNSSLPAGRRSCSANSGRRPISSTSPSIITDDVVGYWPGGRTVRCKAEYMQALEELITLLPDFCLGVPEQSMSADGEFGFSRRVMHTTGANGPSR